MNVFAYIRVSSKGQVDGDGPERQRQAINAFAVEHGLNVYGDYFDSITGTVEDRPAFTKMLNDLVAHNEKNPPALQVHCIVVERMDRLARDLMVSEFLLRECRELNIQVFACDQGQKINMAADDADPTRVLIRQILGALSQWEKSALVKKLKAARERAALEGRVGGEQPYGTLPGEAEPFEIIRQGLRLNQSYQEIAETLDKGDFRTRKRLFWTPERVRQIVRSQD